MIDCGTLRLMEQEDIPSIAKMLEIEGIEQQGHYHTRKNNFTFVLKNKTNEIIGFFTLNFVHGYINLQHFCVAREFRTPQLARKLIKYVRNIVKQLGESEMIVHGRGEKLNKIISWYFKAKPYKKTKDGALLYLVRV